MRSLAAGFRYVRHNGVVGGMLLVDTNAMLFGMPSALFPALASQHFHGGSATFGLLVAAPGLGAIIGGATSGWTSHLRRPGLVVIGAGIVWGGAIFVRAGPSLPLALASWRWRAWATSSRRYCATPCCSAIRPTAARPGQQPVPGPGDRRAALGNVEAGGVARLFSPAVSVVSGGLACVAGALFSAR